MGDGTGDLTAGLQHKLGRGRVWTVWYVKFKGGCAVKTSLSWWKERDCLLTSQQNLCRVMRSNKNRIGLLLAMVLMAAMGAGVHGQNVGIGTTTPGYKLHVIGDIYANGGWFRVSGNQGLYWETWGGGFFMQDGTWIRTYNSRSIWAGTGLLGADGGLTIGTGGGTPPGGGAIIMGNTGMGTTAPNQRLSVQGNVELIENHDNVLLSRNTLQGRSHHIIGTYMGWDQNAIYLAGYNANNPTGSYTNANKVYCGGPTGSIPIYATGFINVSSQRYKQNFAPMTYGLAAVQQLQPMTYHYNFETDPSQKKHLGLIAEEVVKVIPEVVAEEGGNCLGLDYSSLVPVLIKAIQEQQAMMEAQNARIQVLEEALRKLGGE